MRPAGVKTKWEMSPRLHVWIVAHLIREAMPSDPPVIPIHASSGRKQFGGEIYAFSGMVGHTGVVAEFLTVFGCGQLPAVGFEDCESLVSRLSSRKVVAATYLLRHFLAIQDMLNWEVLINILWIRCPSNPAEGLTKHKFD